MKLRQDQVRFQGLLKETITLLCKTGLNFKKGFVVDALIGITTDDSETFLVKIEDAVIGHSEKTNGDGDRNRKVVSRLLRKRRSHEKTHTLSVKRHRADPADDDSDDDNTDGDTDGDTDAVTVKDEPDDKDFIPIKQEQPDDQDDSKSHADGTTSGDAVPANTAPADTTPDDASPDDTTPADTAPDDTTPDDAAPDDAVPANTAPADTTPDDAAAAPDDSSPIWNQSSTNNDNNGAEFQQVCNACVSSSFSA